MQGGDWARANALFNEWLDRPADEVGLLLKELETTEPGVGSLVSDLLDVDRDTSFLGFDLSSLLRDVEQEGFPDPWIGKQLGPYRLESLLGAGGMGSVYLASHVNFQGLAAVKILSDSFSSERRARFDYEKKHLGQLSHPSIAKIFHADVHDDGTLFFAMEYVEGKAIGKYCDDVGLALRKRLELLLRVCEAVQAAHSKGIIHRDIKPSNVLVTQTGLVKLLDFGIAEVADTDSGLELNFISLPYASPEYEDALPSISSDIYSLGILMYEIITDRLPIPTEGKSRQQIRALVRAGDFAPPSTSCDKQRHHEFGALQWRELDWIFARATALQPDDRYVTTDSFARDLQAFLAGTPLALPAAPALYRTRKFIRRYRQAVILACTATVALLLIVTGYTLQLREARNRAVADAAKAKKLTDFVQQMFDFVGQSSGSAQTITPVDMIDRGIPMVDVIHDDPTTQSELYNYLALDYADLGALDKADNVLDRALALDKRNFGDNSLPTAKTMMSLSQLRGAQGLYQESERLALQAQSIEARILRPDDRDRLESEEVLAETYYQSNKNEQAVALEESLIKKIKGDDNLDLLADAYNTLGLAENNRGHDAEALAANQSSLEIETKLHGESNPNAGSHLMTSAAIEARRGDYASAIGQYKKAVEIFSHWFGPNHPHTADTQIALGETMAIAGDSKDALPILLAALPVEKTIWSDASAPVARAYNALGIAERGLGNKREARAYFLKSLASYRVIDTNGSGRTATVLYHLANADLEDHLYQEANSEVLEAIAIDTRIYGPDDLYTLRSLLLSGLIDKAEHRNAEAEHVFSSICKDTTSKIRSEFRSRACAELQTISR